MPSLCFVPGRGALLDADRRFGASLNREAGATCDGFGRCDRRAQRFPRPAFLKKRLRIYLLLSGVVWRGTTRYSRAVRGSNIGVPRGPLYGWRTGVYVRLFAPSHPGKSFFIAEVSMCGSARVWTVRFLAIAVCWVYLSSEQHVRAGSVYKITITGGPPPANASLAYNGEWKFNVTLSADKSMIMFTVISGNTADNTTDFKTDTYTYPVTNSSGVYSFSGSSVGSLPDSKLYDLGMTGSFTPASGTLTITNPVTSKLAAGGGDTYNFKWTNIAMVPEPSSLVLGVIALGILGGGLAFKRRSKPDGGPAKEGAVLNAM